MLRSCTGLLAGPVRRFLVAPLALVFAFVLAGLPAHDACAQLGPPSESVVKAAYLSKLGNYVEWPVRAAPPPNGRIVIGIVGADDVANSLSQMSAVRDPVKGTIAVRRLRNGDALDNIHILYLGDGYAVRAGAMIDQAASRSILVVTESDDALSRGSVINFRLLDERIRFDISLESAEKAGLRLSSQLLALAATVIREKRK
ncbi:YfiR family protein [Massilia litorea]|uniref:YfiR family protein n=1 Tax=Massilia litorea TaxID=2769491 RepID=A0A7L9U355_9BURK|nr:YfiR family protein [Massilia litorea]QOL49454.1 YfiR family protein [Massilia litorea]